MNNTLDCIYLCSNVKCICVVDYGVLCILYKQCGYARWIDGIIIIIIIVDQTK